MTTFDFCGELKKETDSAYLFFDGDNDVWLPKSQISEMYKMDGYEKEYCLQIPEWLAIKKGIA